MHKLLLITAAVLILTGAYFASQTSASAKTELVDFSLTQSVAGGSLSINWSNYKLGSSLST